MEGETFAKRIDGVRPERSRENLGLTPCGGISNDQNDGSHDKSKLQDGDGSRDSQGYDSRGTDVMVLDSLNELITNEFTLTPTPDNFDEQEEHHEGEICHSAVTPGNNQHQILIQDRSTDENVSAAQLVENLDYSPVPLQRNKILSQHVASLLYLMDFCEGDEMNLYCDALLQKYRHDKDIEIIVGLYQTAKLLPLGQINTVVEKLDELRLMMNNALSGETTVLYVTWRAMVEFMTSGDPAVYHDMTVQALQVADSLEVNLPKVLALRNMGTSFFLLPEHKDPDEQTWWKIEKYLGFAHQACIECQPDLESDRSLPVQIQKSLYASIIFSYTVHLFQYYPMPTYVFNFRHIPEIPKQNMRTVRNSLIQLKSVKEFLCPIHKQMYVFFKCDFNILSAERGLIPKTQCKSTYMRALKLLERIPGLMPPTHDEDAKKTTEHCAEYRRRYILNKIEELDI